MRLTCICIHASSSPSTASVIKARSARSPGDPSLSGRSQGSCGEGKLQLPTLNPLLSLAHRFGKCGLVSGSSRRPRSLALQPHSHLVMARAAASPLLRRLHPPPNRASNKKMQATRKKYTRVFLLKSLALPPSGLWFLFALLLWEVTSILVCLNNAARSLQGDAGTPGAGNSQVLIEMGDPPSVSGTEDGPADSACCSCGGYDEVA